MRGIDLVRFRTAFLATLVAVVALGGVALLLSGGLGSGMTRVFATTDPSLNFSISSTGCDSDSAANCNVSTGSSFSVAFNMKSLPSNGEYAIYMMDVSWTAGLTGPPPGVKSPGVHQTGAGNWPDCVLLPLVFSNSVTATTANAVCGTEGNPTSTYVGALLHMDFACPGTAGTFTIRLGHGDPFTSVNSFAGATYSEAQAPAHEDLTVNCVPDADHDGLPDTFESGFGAGTQSIQITNPENGGHATATGSAATGSTITTGSLTVHLPAGTQVGSGGTQILIEYQQVPPAAHVKNATWPNQNSPTGPRKYIEMPAPAPYTAVCITDKPDALISDVTPGNCSTIVAAGCQQFALQLSIPRTQAARSMDPDGLGPQTCVPTTYTVTAQPGGRVRVDGLVYTAVGLVPEQTSLGGVAAYPDLRSGPGFGVLAGILAAAMTVVALGGWYARRRLMR